MTEKQKIKNLIKEHKAILEVTDMDVAESTKGHWLFIRYDKEHRLYDALSPFETAEELAEMIVGELAVDIFSTIDCMPEEQPEFKNFADDVHMVETYKPHIKRLLEYLD